MLYAKINDVNEIRKIVIEEIEKIQKDTTDLLFLSIMGTEISSQVLKYDLDELLELLIPERKNGLITVLVMYDAREKDKHTKDEVIKECEETIDYWKKQHSLSEITSYFALVDSVDKYEAIGVLCRQDDFDEESSCENKLCYLYGKHDSTMSRDKVELVFGSADEESK